MKKTRNLAIGISFFFLILFVLLSYKDAFSVRTLVPNVEPYPDSLYYSIPAWNFVSGKGFNMNVYGMKGVSIVPPLYSFYLIPFFAIVRDIRVYYFANMILSIGSYLIFSFIVYKQFVSSNRKLVILGTLQFLYTTSFYIYTMPSLLMAENPSLFLILLSMVLFTLPRNKPTIIFFVIVSFAQMLIKFSNIPLTLCLLFLYAIHLYKQRLYRSAIVTFIISFICCGAGLF
ncbi:MAG: hypothetical protein WCO06_05755, partial [Candidatus Roizmanbacteria bacterium]